MPTVAKRQPPPPLMEIAWTTRKKGQTKTVAITLGSPLQTMLLFLAGSQFTGVQRVARSIWMALCAGR